MSSEQSGSTISPELLSRLINLKFGVIGRTASTKTEPNSSGSFQFWLSSQCVEQGIIEIGSIVVALLDDNRDMTFGIVNEMRSFSDCASFSADYVNHNLGQPYTTIQNDFADVVVATCAVIQNLSAKTKPVGRSRVYLPSSTGIQYAFGMVNEQGANKFSGATVPVGVFQNGDGTVAPISIDENFLLGPEAAHLNVSGISGLACKTSALQFCLKSLLRYTRKNVGVVVINVKSKDLLYIDQLNKKLMDDEWSQKVYKQLDIPMEPFLNSRFYAPAHPSIRGETQSLRQLETEPFRWDIQMMYEDIPSLFHQSEWDENLEGAWYVIREDIEKGKIHSYTEMLDWIDKLLGTSGLTQWPKGYTTATWHKLKGHLRRFTQLYKGLIATDGEGTDIPWHRLRNGRMFVVDIQMLSDGGQRLVFGRCIRAVTQLLEARKNDLDSVIVFVDELNKFAPAGSQTSALKSRLVEVTARGRSLGLILFGAEQFASSTEKEIVENSSTYMFGRTETTELDAAHYGALSPEVKTKLTMLPQGQLLVKFPKFPQPIFVKFPYPTSLPGDDFRGTVKEASSAPIQKAAVEPAVMFRSVANAE